MLRARFYDSTRQLGVQHARSPWQRPSRREYQIFGEPGDRERKTLVRVDPYQAGEKGVR